MQGYIKITCEEASREEIEDCVKIDQKIHFEVKMTGVNYHWKSALLSRFARTLHIDNPLEAAMCMMEGFKIQENAREG